MAISTYRINAEIQGRINEGTVIDNSEKSLGKKAKVTFRVGDRVINTRNTEAVLIDMEDGRPGDEVPIVNGDIGIVLGLYWKGTFYDDEDLDDLSPAGRSEIVNGKPKDLKMVVDFYEHTVLIPIRNNHLDLAYAVTCHKFQGSECPAVIIPLPRGANNLLCRSWIYTALSRGKELVVVVGPKTAFGYACMTPDRKRSTFLSHFVVSEMDKMLTPQVIEEDDLGWESVETVF
jgi:ATP-dependent exoDNAse (exonuclease V) alpha subunit